MEEIQNKPNPNGANATQSDPREQICWDLYVKSILEGKENAYASAIEAGYTESSAKNITLRDWFKERLGKLIRKEMYSDSEKLLHKTIKYNHVDAEGNIKVDLLRVQTGIALSLTEKLGKADGYSTRNELTGVDGTALMPENISIELRNKILSSVGLKDKKYVK